MLPDAPSFADGDLQDFQIRIIVIGLSVRV